MNSHITFLKNRFRILLYIILFSAAILPALLAVKNIRIYPDSMVYSLISQELLSGNGIRLPIIRLEDSLDPVDGTIPYPEEAPLLPVLYALLGGVTPQNYLAAQIVNVISHIVIVFVTFLLMKKIHGHRAVALLTGVLASLSFPLLLNTHRMATESLFIALAVSSVYFLVLSRHTEGSRSLLNLSVAGICAGLTVTARFPGVALIPVFFWEVFMLVKRKSIKSKYITATLAAMLPVIMMGVLFIRNYLHSETIFGWNPPPFERSYISAIAGTLKMILLQFRVGERPVLLIASLSAAVILYCIVNKNARREISRYMDSGLDAVTLFILSYGGLICLAMVKSQSVYELRFVSPLVPFLLILSVLLIVVLGGLIGKERSQLSFYGIVLALGILAAGIFYKTYANSEMFLSRQETQYFLLKSPTFQWIKENYREGTIITSNKPYHLSFFGGYSTIAIPHRRFDVNYRIDHIESILPERMSKFGSRALALFLEAEEQYDGAYVAGLFNKRADDHNFVLIKSFPDGVVYNLKE